jgi:hypothetical protein
MEASVWGARYVGHTGQQSYVHQTLHSILLHAHQVNHNVNYHDTMIQWIGWTQHLLLLLFDSNLCNCYT